MELKEAMKIEEVPGFSTDSGIEAVSSESSRHVAPISGTEVTFRAFSNLGLSSSPDRVQEKNPDASPAMKVQERSQGVFSRGQTPEEPKVQGKPAADSETWGDGGFMLFKECHYERSPVKESTEPFSLFNKDPSPDQDSPDSPFEVLDDSQRKNSFGKEFLETMTSDWVPTQIAAAKVVSDVEQAKDEKDQGPFGPLADIHNIEVTTKLEKTDWAKEPAYKSMQKEAKEDSDESRDSTLEPDEEEKKISPVSGGKTAPPPPPPLPPRQAKPIDTQVEEIKKQASPAKASSGEDLNFLPTAFIWEKPEKDAEKTQQTLEKSCADFENLPPAYTEVGTATSSSSSPPSYASFKFDTEELLKSQQPATAKLPEGIKGNVSNKPSESVATSLRFLSQPGSFAPVVFDSHSQALGDKNLPDPPMELKEAMKIEEVPGFSTDSGIEAVSSESSRHVAPISGTEVTFRAFSNLGLSSSPDRVQEKNPDASPAMKVQERSQGVFSRGQTPEEPKVQGKPAADSETWGDGGFMLFKECHYERSPVKESTEPFSLFNKDPSPDQDSPDSPFEVLDDSQRKNSFGKEFLETMTSDCVPTQIAAAKVVSDVEQAKDEKHQGPFGPLADIHNIEVTTKLEKTDWAKEPAYKSMQKEAKEDSDESRDSTLEPDEEEKKISPVSGGKTAPPPPPPLPPRQAKPIDTQVEEIKKQASPAKASSGEDLNFLPTAFIWEKPEKDAEKTQQTLEKSCVDFENLPPAYTEVGTATATSSSSSPPSYASFKFDTEELLKSQQPATAKVPGLIWGVDSEPVENLDADSSGESDDTVIEDVSVVTEREPAVPKSTATVKDPEEMKQEVAPAKLEKPLLVPIINVIETEEQIVSDDESDEQASAVVVEPADRAGNDNTTPPADTTPQDSKPAGPVLGKEDSQPTAAKSKTEKPKQDSEPVLDDSEIKSLTQDSESIFADFVMETQDPKPVLADPKIEKPSSVLADFAKEKPTQDQKPILFR
ncbi:UNVERIFIED_CONTAM: hypothetical protein FKN15_036515 [Acipenser sinensis]